jgi:general secretion pathway protein A
VSAQADTRTGVYLDFFGLTERPFSTSPDPRFVYLTREHKAAIAKCRYAVSEGLGLTVVYGDIGTGKSTLARLLYGQFRNDGYLVAMLPNVLFSTDSQFVRAVSRAFRVPEARSLLDMLDALQGFLLDAYARDQRAVLMVDEAQALSGPALELVRQILNFESDSAKLLQVALFGQNELRAKIHKRKALRSRIAITSTLDPLPPEEVPNLIRYRLMVAGRRAELLTPEAYEAVFLASQGIPRAICTICDNALLQAFLDGHEALDADIIQRVVEEIEVE